MFHTIFRTAILPDLRPLAWRFHAAPTCKPAGLLVSRWRTHTWCAYYNLSPFSPCRRAAPARTRGFLPERFTASPQARPAMMSCHQCPWQPWLLPLHREFPYMLARRVYFQDPWGAGDVTDRTECSSSATVCFSNVWLVVRAMFLPVWAPTSCELGVIAIGAAAERYVAVNCDRCWKSPDNFQHLWNERSSLSATVPRRHLAHSAVLRPAWTRAGFRVPWPLAVVRERRCAPRLHLPKRVQNLKKHQRPLPPGCHHDRRSPSVRSPPEVVVAALVEKGTRQSYGRTCKSIAQRLNNRSPINTGPQQMSASGTS
jgi:hypothetical protein